MSKSQFADIRHLIVSGVGAVLLAAMSVAGVATAANDAAAPALARVATR